MRTKVFVYKNVLGIESHHKDAEGLINDPIAAGQLGFVLDASKVDIQQEAIDWMENMPTTGDDIGAIDTFKADSGIVIFSWLGGPRAVMTTEREAPCISDFSLLTATEFETPAEFKSYVDDIGAYKESTNENI